MKKLLIAIGLSTLASAAVADDLPVLVSKAQPATVVSASGWYLSVDGGWQNVGLPDYGLGFTKVTSPTFPDAGPFQIFKPRLDGYMFRGTIGYYLPATTSNTFFGGNTRVEIGGSYGQASGSDSGTAVFTGGGIVTQTLEGAGANGGWSCFAGQICTTNSNLSTDYSNWQVHGRIAGDYLWGTILVTPSLAVFGGGADTDQALDQIARIGGAAGRPTNHASSSLHWIDIGARAGLDLKVDVSPRVALNLGGWAGIAGRHASLSASEVATDPIGGGLIAGAGSISDSADATPLIANIEAGVAYKLLPTFIVRGFAGVNIDTEVPGIAPQSYSGGVGSITSRTPAGISFDPAASYYAGGGVTWTF